MIRGNMRFLPREEKFYHLFSAQAQLIAEASALLLAGAQALDFRLGRVAAEGSKVRPGAGVEEAHRRIRSVVPHLDRDRLQGSDIESAARLVREGSLVDLVSPES